MNECYSFQFPEKPFDDYKWKWATTTCTESLNDPVVLLGVLGRMRKLEGAGLKYSSPEFNYELIRLEQDIEDSVPVSLSSRGGRRNLIRNSGQYWKAVGLIPADSHGLIELTDFGRKVAERDISKSEFAAITIRSFKLPNPYTTSEAEREKWNRAKLEIHPLMLILSIVRELMLEGQGWITTDELSKIVIPLAGTRAKDPAVFAERIKDFRENPDRYSDWPDCTPRANDKRMVREYLLFLEHYGYLIGDEDVPGGRFARPYSYNKSIDDEIADILSEDFSGLTSDGMLSKLRTEQITAAIDAKKMREVSTRPEQAAFRRSVLETCKRCVITNAVMPEILQAAHIKPHKYNGPESVDNGFAMRMDIHRLFDTNHLRISPEGRIDLSDRARMDYGMTIPPYIVIPDVINREYLRWRWDNYVGLC